MKGEKNPHQNLNGSFLKKFVLPLNFGVPYELYQMKYNQNIQSEFYLYRIKIIRIPGAIVSHSIED